jgi:hypothetical protein
VTLLTLNTLSNKTISSKEEVDDLLLQLVYGIKDFLSYKEYKGSRFYTEEKDIHNFEIINGYQFKEAMKSLKREILDFFSLFLDKQCDSDCLNKITDEEMENILDGDLYFDDELFIGQNYIILSYCVEKRTFLLSFGKDSWKEYKVIAKKVKEDGTSEKLILNNIANKEHSKSHYNNKQFDKLPKENISYSKEFKKWFLNRNSSDMEKILEKINFAIHNEYDRRDAGIGKIDSKEIPNLYEIVVGNSTESGNSAIRIFFKKFKGITHFFYGFIKHNEQGLSYQGAGHINNALTIIKAEKLFI